MAETVATIPVLFQFYTEGKRDNLGSLTDYVISRDELYAYTFIELWLDVGNVDMYNSLQ